jgi:hypothetical protein
MSDKQGNVYKGIAVLAAPDVSFNEMSTVTGNFDQPLTVKHRQALLLCRFIEEVLSGSLPKKIEVKTNGPTLKIHLKKNLPKIGMEVAAIKVGLTLVFSDSPTFFKCHYC